MMLLLVSCKKDLSGHWHAQMDNFEYKLDIENNQKCYWVNHLTDDPINGIHISEENKIELYAQSCGVYDFEYEIKGNSIYIKNSLGKKIILEKKPNCNKIDDYTTKLSIDFLKLSNSIKDSIYNPDLNEYINIGFSKEKNSLAIESWKLDGLKTINQIDSFVFKIEEYSPKQYIPFINYVLTPDRNISGKTLNEIISVLNRNGKKKIYIRTLKDEFNVMDRDVFEYINLNKHKLDFESDKTLNDIIKNYLQQ